MRHLAAYLLLVLGGNATPSASDVTAALEQVGVEVDETRLNTLISELEGKDLEELISLGKEKLQKATGAAAASGAAAGGEVAAAAAPAPVAAVKEEAEEVDLGGGMDMFGGGDGGSY